MSTLLVKLVGKTSRLPEIHSEGYDLFSPSAKLVKSGGSVSIYLGILIDCPSDLDWSIKSHPILEEKGVYVKENCTRIRRGEILIQLDNYSDADFEIKQGELIARLILTKTIVLPVQLMIDNEFGE